ncbi:MAG: hypothetical protein ACTSUE_25290 [Promethearchaeota archaeon]
MQKPLTHTRPVDYCFGSPSYPLFYSISPEEKETPYAANPSCWTPLAEYYNSKTEQAAIREIDDLLKEDDMYDKKDISQGGRSISDTSRTHSPSSEGHTLIREEEKCYLCMRYILPNAEPFIVLPCYDSCRSKFHFLCIVNTLWHFREAELVCPICTDPRNDPAEHPKGKDLLPPGLICRDENTLRGESPWCFSGAMDLHKTLFAEFLKNPENVKGTFLSKLFPMMGKILGNRANKFETLIRCTSIGVENVRNMISEGASSIYDMSYGSLGESSLKGSPNITSLYDSYDDEKKNNKLASQMMRRMEFGKLLSYGVSVMEIYLFLTNSFRGLLFINFSLRDIKKLEEMGQVQTLVNLYNIKCDDLRAILGGQLSIQNLISFEWNAQTFYSLGLDMHQLCILRLQKDNIPSFGFTMEEWLNELRMTKTVVKILRIHANDFQRPGGKLTNAGWDLGKIIYRLRITVKEVVDFRLNGYSSCLGKKTVGSVSVKKVVVVAEKKINQTRRSPELKIENSEGGDNTNNNISLKKKPMSRGDGLMRRRKDTYHNVKHSHYRHTRSTHDSKGHVSSDSRRGGYGYAEKYRK